MSDYKQLRRNQRRLLNQLHLSAHLPHYNRIVAEDLEAAEALIAGTEQYRARVAVRLLELVEAVANND